MALIETAPCWMRQIEVRLYSQLTNQQIVYGGIDSDQLNIDISGEKHISSTENNGTVAISNLTYSDILKIIDGEYYQIEIWVGYRTSSLVCWFAGEVAYISNKIQQNKDYTAYILFASRFVAQFSQKRISLTVNSSINLYTMINNLCANNGLKINNLSKDLKDKYFTDVKTLYGSPVHILEQLENQTGDFDISSDSSLTGSVVDVSTLSDKRRIVVNPNTIIFSGGNPTLNSDGLSVKLMPTFNYTVGDIIIIDNSYIDLSESSLSSAQSNFNANYLDTSYAGTEQSQYGAYMIRKITYHFQNRGDSFELNVLAKSISLIENLIGES